MDNHDDKTIVGSLPKGLAVRRVASVTQTPLTLLSLGDGQGINPLVNAAGALLILLAELKQAHDCVDVNKLRERLINEIKTFTAKAQTAKVDATQINLASFLLCAALDEAILNILHKRDVAWSQQALLSVFHKEGGAGEKFFSVLEHLGQDPMKNQSLLELASLCLNMGFEGKYRVMQNGAVQLEQLKENLANQIVKLRGASATQWATEVQPLKRKYQFFLRFPFHNVLAGLVLLSTISYAVFFVMLNHQAGSTVKLLKEIGVMQSRVKD
jgi:type VI secretion system protein ImpK